MCVFPLFSDNQFPSYLTNPKIVSFPCSREIVSFAINKPWLARLIFVWATCSCWGPSVSNKIRLLKSSPWWHLIPCSLSLAAYCVSNLSSQTLRVCLSWVVLFHLTKKKTESCRFKGFQNFLLVIETLSPTAFSRCSSQQTLAENDWLRVVKWTISYHLFEII